MNNFQNLPLNAKTVMEMTKFQQPPTVLLLMPKVRLLVGCFIDKSVGFS